jgi:6-phospho-beta-glucosidase
MDSVPEELAKRGGYGYSRLVAMLIRGLLTDDHSIRYAIVRNGTTLPELPADAFVEVPVLVLADAIRPVQVDPLPVFARGLVATMKDYERLCIQAARERSRRLLLQALLVHPLIGTFDGATALLADVLEANRRYLPDFT